MRAGLRLHRGDRIARHLLRRRLVVQQQMHEGGVGAVLQQPPHQIGQQVLVRADRRIDAQRQRPEPLRRRVVQRLAHAVQALVLDRDAGRSAMRAHRRQGVGVVGGELGVEMRARRRSAASAQTR